MPLFKTTTIPEFEKLTLNKQYQRYITLEEGKIRFDELPLRPHGEIVGLLNSVIARQVEGANYLDGLECASDNGIPFVNRPAYVDCKLNKCSVKHPDLSFHLHRNCVPQPPPGWLKFMRNGAPYPNIVVEVAVNHERPTKLMEDCQRYFTATTSVRLWIGVKYRTAGTGWICSQTSWRGWRYGNQ